METPDPLADRLARYADLFGQVTADPCAAVALIGPASRAGTLPRYLIDVGPGS